MRGKRLIVAGVTAILLGGLGACSSGSDGGPKYVDAGGSGADAAQTGRPSTDAGANTDTDTVSGLRDTVRHLSAKTARATRPHLVRKCTTGTRRVRHTSSSGTGTKRKTRTWYSTEHYRDCKKVRSGTETYRRLVRPEKWCVRLDDVDGVRTRDDVWYEVTDVTYRDALGTDEHARMEFTPAGTGC
ncbi:hypothetical protein ACIRU3_02715 [Streptomyces sp. NPDC101151]|uniref:hypothetical protein n=1 Tax=Streptomyces sp. NPDC101151 TaxID=3366115 RepID=UPI00380EAF8E